MSLMAALRWILDSSNYGGENGIDTRVVEHLQIALLVLAIPEAHEHCRRSGSSP